MCARAADTTSVTLREARVLRRNTLVRIGALSSAAALVALLGPSLPAAAQAGQPGTRVVVRLVSDANSTVKAQDSQQSGSQVSQVYDGAITGYAATVPAAELGRLARDPAVLSIEPDTTLRTSDTQNSARGRWTGSTRRRCRWTAPTPTRSPAKGSVHTSSTPA